jgi:hypothetical protein
MSNAWVAKVHKSGNRVAIFNGTKLVKVVESSKDTFEPAEAQKFAEELVNELQNRSATQMTDGNAPPSVTWKKELHPIVENAVNTQATGKAPHMKFEKTEILDDAGASDATGQPGGTSKEKMLDEDEKGKVVTENQNLREVVAALKKKLSQVQNERITERKARRGLAIAKQMVADGRLEDSHDAIKNKIAQIIKLEDSEIDRLEKKVAGEQEFNSIEEATKELRRQSRIARINRQAAAEAQEDNDEEEADTLDTKADEAEAKAAHVEQIVNEMKKADKEEDEEKPVEETDEKVEEKADDNVERKKTLNESDDLGQHVNVAKEEKEPEQKPVEEKPAEQVKPEEEPTEKSDDCGKTGSKETLAAMARKYRKIATDHRKLAEKDEAEGDIASADKHDDMADDAEDKAEEIEKKLAEAEKPVEEPKPEEKVEKDEKPEEKVEDDKEAKKEEKKDDPAVEEAEKAEPKAEETEEKKAASRKEPGKVVASDKHSPLKREDGEVVDSFGIDKNASLVEQNDYTDDPDVEILSKMWRGAPKDGQE